MSEADLEQLREQLKDDPFGLELLDFETHPQMVINGCPVTREQRIDGASMRPAVQALLAKALRDLQPPALGSAFDKATLTVEATAA
jgi:hypothetical protein